jgi:hypothetical protein
MDNPKLSLEVLNGPLDGYVATIENETVWGSNAESPLGFPWDKELGERQARFFFEEEHWWIEDCNAPHGTYFLNPQERIEVKTQLKQGHLLKASDTWLLIRQVE